MRHRAPFRGRLRRPGGAVPPGAGHLRGGRAPPRPRRARAPRQDGAHQPHPPIQPPRRALLRAPDPGRGGRRLPRPPAQEPALLQHAARRALARAGRPPRRPPPVRRNAGRLAQHCLLQHRHIVARAPWQAGRRSPLGRPARQGQVPGTRVGHRPVHGGQRGDRVRGNWSCEATAGDARRGAGVGVEWTIIMANTMVNAYSKAGRVDDARQVFDQISIRDSITWTSMIAGYCQAKRIDKAVQVFDMMPDKDRIAWTALISRYEQNGEEDAALELFEQMLAEGVWPTAFALVSALGACAKLGLVTRGKELHCFILRWSVGTDPFNIFIYNALIDMYCKCGDMMAAVALFRQMPERDYISWNSIVTGFSHNGLGKQSLAIFEEMLVAGVRPTHVTFLAVLTACSHSGLVSDARLILESTEGHGLEPRAEHYAAYIDALGRNHKLEEATEFIKDLPSKIGPGTTGSWGALLGACRLHGNIELAQEVAEFLFRLEPGNSGRYVMLSNIYAAAGQWDDARRVRGLMKEKGLKKDQAYSWIEVRSAKHVFVAEDMSHHEADAIYEMLGKLLDHMCIAGDPTEHQLDFC